MTEPNTTPTLDPGRKRRWAKGIALGLLLITPAVAAIWYSKHRGTKPKGGGSESSTLATRAVAIGSSAGRAAGDDLIGAGGTVVEQLPETSSSKALELRHGAPIPSVVVFVRQPPKLRQALADNDWLQSLARQPLGKGFLESWAGFLLTRGEDLRAQFTGTVAQYFADRLLQSPFFVIWYGGPGAGGAPAIVLSSPKRETKAAFDGLTELVGRGKVEMQGCPGDQSKSEADPAAGRGDGGSKPAEGGAGAGGVPGVEIQRWLIADRPLFAAANGQRLVFGRSANTVAAGLCTSTSSIAAWEKESSADLDVAFSPRGLGYDARMLAHLLGFGPDTMPRIEFMIEQNRIVPRGIEGRIGFEGRLGKAALSESMLKTIPEEVPVVFAMQLKLPPALTAEAMKSALEGTQVAGADVRQVVLLWRPHGDPAVPSEVALVWSQPSDQKALMEAFNGANTMETKTACGNLVFSSTRDLLERIEETCAGKSPSILNAAPQVVAGWKKPSSVALGVNLGRVLSQVTLDAYQRERGKGAPSAEIRKALETLEALPFLGFTGAVEQKALVPGGFRS